MAKEDESVTFDAILEKAGHVGRWQWQVFVVAAVGSMFNAVHNLSSVFLAITPDHWCQVPDFPENLTWSSEVIKHYTIPLEERQGSIHYSRCRYYVQNYSLDAMLHKGAGAPNASTPTASCSEWEFDTSQYESTTVTKWDLVCDRQPLVATIQAIHMFGVLVGDIVISSLSDRFGRRTAALFAITLMVSSAILVAFSPSYIMLIAFRFLAAVGSSGNYCAPYVIITEITGSAKLRAFFGTIYNIPFAMGYMILPAVAYYVRDWSNLQLALSLPSLLLIGHYWLLPESPRWLTTHGRFLEALEVLKHGARLNGRTLPDDDVMLLEMKAFKENEDKKKLEQQQNQKCPGVQLCATSGARNLTFIAYFTWCSVAMVYYGLALNAPKLSSNMYLLFFLGGVVEVPAYVITYFLLRFAGRRPSYSGTFLLAGVACLATLIDTPGIPWLRPAFAITGKFCVTITFTISYLYTAELFPTILRSVAIGLGSTFARFGAIAAPYIVELLSSSRHETVPLLVFGCLSVSAGFAALFLPETRHSHLPETFRSVHCPINRCRKGKKSRADMRKDEGQDHTQVDGLYLPHNELSVFTITKPGEANSVDSKLNGSHIES